MTFSGTSPLPTSRPKRSASSSNRSSEPCRSNRDHPDDEAPPATHRPTSSGGTRSGVAALQVALKSRGVYSGSIDGIIGPRTIAAVRVFQRRHRLTVDGIPGPVTCAALGPYSRHRLGTRTLTFGDNGWDVTETQFLLRSHGYSPGPLDGSYGGLSVAAVRRFQRHSALQVDGVVGSATLASLDGKRAEGPGGLTTGEAGHARAARRLVIVRRDAHRLYLYRGARPLCVPSGCNRRGHGRPHRMVGFGS